MNNQTDMFPVVRVNQVALRRDLARKHARSPHVEAEILAIVRARPGEWLTVWDLSSVTQRHDIGANLGHVLHEICSKGLIDERISYFEGIPPSAKGYIGFQCQFRAAAPLPDYLRVFAFDATSPAAPPICVVSPKICEVTTC